MAVHEVAALSNTPPEDIAIVGMANLFPGSDTPARFWQNILDKRECVSDPPRDWQPECFFDPTGRRKDLAYTGRGGYLGDLARFDPLKFGVMPSSMEGAEPDHFLVLKTAAAALRDAGVPEVPLNRQRCGVVLGRGVFLNRGLFTWIMQGYMVDQVVGLLAQVSPDTPAEKLARIRDELSRNIPPFNADTVPGMTHCVLTGRIANRFDLNGPAYTLDAACASSLLAAEHGVEMLRSGRCDAVLVGGSHVSNPGLVQLAFCHLGALSRKGCVAPFSADADGTLLGQGCGVLVLKRRSDAERDGNRIYALIKAVGLSSDGNGAGLLAPRQEGQEIAIRRAYERAGISPDTIGLIEAHGTGIPLGDATELRSLSSVFGPRTGDRPTVAIGSVKSMISHLVPAAGSASLMKVALSLYHRVLPPTLHAEQTDPKLGLDGSRFYVNTAARPWIHSGAGAPRRAGINAFGFGGSNAHAILEEYVPADESALRRVEPEWPAELVVVGAADRAGLKRRCESLASWCESAAEVGLLDIAAAACKESGATRAAFVAHNREELVGKLRHAAKLLDEPNRTKIQDRSGIFWYEQPLARQGRVAFVFPGEGSQYVNMLAEVALRFPEVRRQFDLTDRAFARRTGGRLLSPLIYPIPGREQQAEHELIQLGGAVTSVTAAGRALFALLSWLGVRPDAVLGHSSGEFGALMAAGVLPADDDEQLIRVIAEGAESAAEMARSDLVPPAVLTSVGGTPRTAIDAVLAASGGRLRVAMENCPNQLVLVGDEEATAAALDGLRGKGGLCERLSWGRAYHTESFRPATRFIDAFFRSVGLRSPRIETWSCASAARFPADPQAVHELAVRQWYSPVRFADTVRAMHAAGVRVFVEVGPRGNLSAFITDTLTGEPHAAVPLDLPRKNGIEQLCRALGMLVAHGVGVKLEKLYERRSPRPMDLNAAPPKVKRDPILPLELPELRVSPAIAAELNTRPREAQQATASPAAEREGTIERRSRVAASAAAAPGPAVSALAPAARRTTSPADVPVPARDRAVIDFQRTMREFLDVQQSILARTAQPAPKRAEPGGNGDSNGQPAGRAPQAIAAMSDQLVARAPAATAVSDTSRSAAPSRPAGAATAAVPAARRPEQATTDLSVTALPFIETVLTHEPGLKLVAECELDERRHPYLLDHTFFGRPVSAVNPQLAGLPVAPLAFTLELAAEAAVKLSGGRIAAIRDVRTRGWLALDKSSRRVRIEAAAQSAREIQVTVSEADKEALNSEIISAVFELGDAPAPLGSPRVPDRAAQPAPWAGDVYGKTLYHGPAFAGIVSVERCDSSGVRARVRQPAQPICGLDGRPLELVLPVALLDVAAQVPSLVNANWSLEEHFVRNVYPNGFERMEWDLSAGVNEALLAVARVDGAGAQLASDVEFIAPGGRVVMRVSGRTDQVVEFPSWVYGGYRFPRTITATRDITDAFAAHCDASHVTICELIRPADAILLGRMWIQVLARLALSADERRAFATRAGTPVALVSWLLGRIAAKDAVRWHMRKTGQRPVPQSQSTAAGQRPAPQSQSTAAGQRPAPQSQSTAAGQRPVPQSQSTETGQGLDRQSVPQNCALCLADVSIDTDAFGKPSVSLPPGSAAPLISLAHKELFAVALAADSTRFAGAGIDLERRKPLAPEVLADGFADAERAAVDACGVAIGDRDAAFVAAWAAKEALAKAVGRGLLGGPRNVEVRAMEARTGRVSLALHGELASAAVAVGGQAQADAVWCVRGEHVLAMCLIERAGRRG
ncbi:MAG: polyketide synthase dehydratase domain-containing protein [Phycisphaerae bacterium]